MTTINIDLVKNPEIADLLADKQPGDAIDLHCSIKALDDQTATLTVEEAEEGTDATKTEDGEGDVATAKDVNDDGRADQPPGGLSPLLGGADMSGMEQAAQ